MAYQPPKKAGNGSAADQSAYVEDRGKRYTPAEFDELKAKRAERVIALETLEADTAAYEESLRPKSEREEKPYQNLIN